MGMVILAEAEASAQIATPDISYCLNPPDYVGVYYVYEILRGNTRSLD